MKTVFPLSYKTFFKENTKNYTPNFYILVFLINVFLFFFLIIWDGGSMLEEELACASEHRA